MTSAFAHGRLGSVRLLSWVQEQERLKTTLWEDRLRRFKEETDEFMQYAAVVPKQLQELEVSPRGSGVRDAMHTRWGVVGGVGVRSAPGKLYT